MANFVLKSCLKDNRIIYKLSGFNLIEINKSIDSRRIYDLTSDEEKLVFQTRLKHYARYSLPIDIDSYLLYYLHYIKWL